MTLASSIACIAKVSRDLLTKQISVNQKCEKVPYKYVAANDYASPLGQIPIDSS